MSRKIPEDFIQTLLSRVDVVDIVSARVKLRKQGANYMGCCPFHQEKSASFSVSQSKQFYYCFGCGASGNAIGFLMNYDKLEFVEAVEELARFAGLEVPRVHESPLSRIAPQKTESILAVLEEAAEFFEKQLRVHSDREIPVNYLKNRGITGVIAQKFRLGYAPQGWSSLLDLLGGSPEKTQILLDAGLLIQNDSGKVYDRFRHRIMFPIRNRKGQVIGFGARSIHPEDQPKYLNSPETPVFHKGSEAYGLYELRQHKGLPDKILITEGYMDVIALVQFGVWFAVATLGTATSKTHIEILLKQSRHLIFSFDGDRAGKEAAWRALQVCLPFMTGDYKIEFLFLPEEHDPDSFIREQGLEVFLDQLGRALPLSQVLLLHLEEKYPLADIESRAQFVRAAIPYLEKLPKGPYLELLLAAIAEKTRMEKSQIAYQLSEAGEGQEGASEGRSFEKPRQESASLNLVEYVTSWIIQYPALVEKLEFPEMTHHSPMVDVLLEVVAYIHLHPKVTTGGLLAQPALTPWSHWLGELAMIDHYVSPEAVILELQESLKKISKERDEKLMNVLIEKSRRQPLTPEEKKKISDFLKKNRE